MSERATPVPIPNTEVKPLSADDSRKAKVGRCLDNGLFLYLISENSGLDKSIVLWYINSFIKYEQTAKGQEEDSCFVAVVPFTSHNVKVDKGFR